MANITNCLTRTIHGKYSMEMMIDTSFTLAHNNGPMHNKGMLYEGYTPEMLTILDVQRAGMMPEMVFERRYFKQHVSNWLLNFVRSIKEMYPNEIGEYVNWVTVKDRGATTNVHGYIQEQMKLHPETKIAKPVNGKIATGGVYEVDHKTSLPILKRVA